MRDALCKIGNTVQKFFLIGHMEKFKVIHTAACRDAQLVPQH